MSSKLTAQAGEASPIEEARLDVGSAKSTFGLVARPALEGSSHLEDASRARPGSGAWPSAQADLLSLLHVLLAGLVRWGGGGGVYNRLGSRTLLAQSAITKHSVAMYTWLWQTAHVASPGPFTVAGQFHTDQTPPRGSPTRTVGALGEALCWELWACAATERQPWSVRLEPDPDFPSWTMGRCEMDVEWERCPWGSTEDVGFRMYEP